MPNDISEEEIIAHLQDRRWRINNLYFIKDSTGKKVQFKMKPVQEYLFDNLHYRNVIPKARKAGISTFFAILNLDRVLFSRNKTAGIIAHKQEDMKKLFRNTILFAVENLHPWMKAYIGKPETSTANEITFDNGGQIFVSLSSRGDSPNFLHISELGYIDRHAPHKSEEIISGAVNSVAMTGENIVSIESTADNGPSGNFYNICMNAEKLRLSGLPLTPMDWKIFFFPWYIDPQYELHNADHMIITEEMQEYFRNIERSERISLTMPKKRWYVKAKETNTGSMTSQFPSSLKESFSVSLEGAYYAGQVNAVYAEQRLGFFPYDPTYKVETAWDLGMNDSTAIVFFQRIGQEIRFVDFYENANVGLDHYVKVLRDKPYRYGRHILPHDVNVRDISTGVSRLAILWELGLSDTVVAPKIGREDGIEKVRMIFNRFRFDEQKAGKILEALQTYRKKWDDKTGTWMDTPFHGPESHVCDAVRYMAVMYYEDKSAALVDEWGDPISLGESSTVSFFG